MNNSNSVPKVVSKLNSILSTQFGVAVQYIPAASGANAYGAVALALESAKRNSGAPMIIAHNQMIIPMRVEGSLVGATRVQKINRLQPRQLSEIRDTIQSLLGSAVLTEALTTAKEVTAKVISFEERKLERASS